MHPSLVKWANPHEILIDPPPLADTGSDRDQVGRGRHCRDVARSLHSKAVVIDGSVAFIGSMNLDPRSMQLNNEVALRIDSPDLGRQLRTLFDEAIAPDQAFRVELEEDGNAQTPLRWTGTENGRIIRYVEEPLASAWRRWITDLLWRWAPEELL